ncbi:hypothetical protein BIU88_03625 [Chlorobaculum limnaeum]|uniref:Uncharacterized protein n=1 Tax=Chlorobaculum limnaeum TaxID=274537 RepID=A0A1D8CYW4_CHLLM|nr:hypothetical protein BIU88_03625 [Chlorobaculum limnaeum]
MVKPYHRCIRFEKKPFNSSAFRNADLDLVVSKLTGPLPQAEQAKLWKEYQQILATNSHEPFCITTPNSRDSTSEWRM